MLGILHHVAHVGTLNGLEEAGQVCPGEVLVFGLHQNLVLSPELARHQPGQTGVGSLPEQVLLVEEPGVQVVAHREHLDSPGGAAPHPGDADEAPDVFLLPGLALLVEEVEGHDGAHAVSDQQDRSVVVLTVNPLNLTHPDIS